MPSRVLNSRFGANMLLALVALAIPVLANWLTATAENVPGTGIDLLIYEPFDFAYGLLVTLGFLGLNLGASEKRPGPILLNCLASLFIGAVWYAVAILLVLQWHIWLVGIL